MKDTFVCWRMHAHVRIKVEELELRDEEAVCLKKRRRRRRSGFIMRTTRLLKRNKPVVCVAKTLAL